MRAPGVGPRRRAPGWHEVGRPAPGGDPTPPPARPTLGCCTGRTPPARRPGRGARRREPRRRWRGAPDRPDRIRWHRWRRPARGLLRGGWARPARAGRRRRRWRPHLAPRRRPPAPGPAAPIVPPNSRALVGLPEERPPQGDDLGVRGRTVLPGVLVARGGGAEGLVRLEGEPGHLPGCHRTRSRAEGQVGLPGLGHDRGDARGDVGDRALVEQGAEVGELRCLDVLPGQTGHGQHDDTPVLRHASGPGVGRRGERDERHHGDQEGCRDGPRPGHSWTSGGGVRTSR